MSSTIELTVSFLCFVFLARWFILRATAPRPRYPPGPKGLPILKNLFDMPKERSWLVYQQWGKEHNSDIIHLNILGQHTFVINSAKTAYEFFDKRSNIYSDRPFMPLVGMMGWGFNGALLPYGDLWRRHRKTFQQGFRKEQSTSYQPIQTEKIHLMLRSMLETPEDFTAHLKTAAAAVIMATVYGHDIAPKDDYFVGLAESAMKPLVKAMLPGGTIVNEFPFLRHIPSWIPGIGFWKIAKETIPRTHAMLNVPFEFVKKNMAEGTGKPSMLADLLRNHDEKGGSALDEEVIKGVTATSYAAGSDTTVSSTATFICAMALHPEIQKKAQAEVDAVVGTGRLPEYSDRDSMPYLEAMYREVMRWQPAFPLSVPHASTEDDIYNGYVIPKGSTIVGNVWAMTRDESIYKDPDTFNPDRFFNADGTLNDDDTVLAYGFGRRLCVGRFMASSSVWLVIATMLACFNITKAKDENGKEIDINPVWTDSGIIHLEPYRCSITPRSAAARKLVEDTALAQ